MSVKCNYFEILDINSEALRNKTEREIQWMLVQCYEDKLLELSVKKENDTKKLVEAYQILSNPASRKAYEEALKAQPASGYSIDIIQGDYTNQLFNALKPLTAIQTEFKKWMNTKSSGEQKGYSSDITMDSFTGKRVLKLQFPDEQVANEFITKMRTMGMLEPMNQGLENKISPELSSSSTFKTPRLSRH